MGRGCHCNAGHSGAWPCLHIPHILSSPPIPFLFPSLSLSLILPLSLLPQYRMNEQIMPWSSEAFYQNRLIAHTSVDTHLLQHIPGHLLTHSLSLSSRLFLYASRVSLSVRVCVYECVYSSFSHHNITSSFRSRPFPQESNPPPSHHPPSCSSIRPAAV